MVVSSDEEEKMAGLANSELLANSLIMYVSYKELFITKTISFIYIFF
jgi:hypothetical protein